MHIVESFRTPEPVFSFEFFPPKNADGVEQLFHTVEHLRELEPTFVSVTYGAGGSTRQLTVELVERIKRETGIEAMAHLTCVGATRDEIDTVLGHLEQAGVENVLALRGDPPKGSVSFEKPEGGFGYANELVGFIKQHHRFCVAGACYPETHQEAASPREDLRRLKAKVDAGAEFLITQLFFNNADYLGFVKRCRDVGITVPILPGIMPATTARQIKRLSTMCGAAIPGRLLADLEAAGDDKVAAREIGVEHALAQCRELLAEGAPGIHFYTLNRSPATKKILTQIR